MNTKIAKRTAAALVLLAATSKTTKAGYISASVDYESPIKNEFTLENGLTITGYESSGCVVDIEFDHREPGYEYLEYSECVGTSLHFQEDINDENNYPSSTRWIDINYTGDRSVQVDVQNNHIEEGDSSFGCIYWNASANIQVNEYIYKEMVRYDMNDFDNNVLWEYNDYIASGTAYGGDSGVMYKRYGTIC